jgi:gliding motility-associated-like protein
MKRSLLIIWSIFVFHSIFGQAPAASDWKHEVKRANVFIENKGQFNQYASKETGEIYFGVDWGKAKILFGKTGIRYYFLEVQNKEDEHEEMTASFEEKEKKAGFQDGPNGRTIYRQDDVSLRFNNANEDVIINGLKVNSDYHNYSVLIGDSTCEGYSYAKGFQELSYENIYPHIDLKFSFHPEQGLKYMFIVHPGGDPAIIEFAYNEEIQLKDNDVHIPTLFGDLIDHKPYSYQGDFENEIASSFSIIKNSVRFNVGSYRKTEDLVIDPWIQIPVIIFSNWYWTVWECDRDDAGNVYIICGDSPMQLQKYSSSGTLLWTYNTPFDYNNSWLGTLAVNRQGISYVTSGSQAKMQKISATGTLINSKLSYALPTKEFWSIAFNCTQDQLIVGGAMLSGPLNGSATLPNGAIFNINPSSLNITSTQIVTTQPVGSTNECDWDEIRSITSSQGGKYYFLTHDTMGYVKSISPNCGPGNTIKMDHDISYDYKMDDYREEKSGICALAADENYLYFNRGDRIEKRDLQNCSLVAFSSLIGGSQITLSSPYCDEYISNSGIAIDECGNIFVGAFTGVIKYNQALVQTGFYSTTFPVFDVAVSTNGNIIAAGSDYIRSIIGGACSPYFPSCCSATICQPEELCITDDPVTLFTETTGGTWYGPGVNAAGIFSPFIAGVGVHTLVYTLPCGVDSIQVTVNPCNVLEVCMDSIGQLNVYGGVGPYSWEYSLSSTFVNFGSGSVIVPPISATQLQVSDGSGIIYPFTISNLAPCFPNVCDSFISTSTITNISCFGQTDGSFSVGNSSGTPPYSYTSVPSLGFGSSFNQLSAGTYVVTVVDMNLCSNTLNIPIVEPPVLTISSIANNTICGTASGSVSTTILGGSIPYSYFWTPGNYTTQNVTNLPIGVYHVSVSDANNCLITDSVSINNISEPTVSTSSSNTLCGGATGIVSANATGGSGPYSYLWTPGNFTTENVVGLPEGTYNVIVHDFNHCQSTATASISNLNQLNLSHTVYNLTCFGGSNGIAVVEATNGTGPYSYVWSPIGGTNSIASNLPAGTFSVQVSDSLGCTDSMQVNITSPPQIVISETIIPSSCTGNNGGVAAYASGGTAPYTYYWSPSGQSGTSVGSLAAGAIVSLNVIDSYDCMVSETYEIPGYGEINVIATPSSITILEGETIEINASGALSYVWSPPDGLACATCPTTTASPTATTLYTVTGTSAIGCFGEAQVQIYVTEVCGEIYIPTILSPSSSNNENKQACVYGNCIAELDYAIYDRWGQCVFETKDQNACWDGKYKGKEMNAGVFTYKLTIKLQNGEFVIRSGNITLLK